MLNRMGWMRWLPGLVTLRQYQPAWLMHDVAAGVVLVTMLIPVGIAASFAGLACSLRAGKFPRRYNQ